MKKIFFIATLALVILSSNLFAREPRFHVHKHSGQKVVLDTGGWFVGYEWVDIQESGILWWYKVTVRCSRPGYEQCSAKIGGTSYFFSISDIDNPESTNDFNADVITNITNELLGTVDQNNIDGSLSGNLSENYSLTDKEGIQHYVNFTAIYELNEEGDGEINVFINTYKP